MEIKKITERHFNSLYELGKQEFQGEFWFTKEFIKTTFKRKSINLGAFENRKLIGEILVDIFDPSKAWIFFLLVDKSKRRKGIGSQLLRGVEKVLPENYYKIYVDFEKQDTLASRFYKNQGFSKSGKIKDWFGLGASGLIYSKTIN